MPTPSFWLQYILTIKMGNTGIGTDSVPMTACRGATEADSMPSSSIFTPGKNRGMPPLGRKNRQIPVSVWQFIKSSSTHPKYAGYEARLKSFKSWSPSHCQDPQELALAGFFYSGFEDETICFCCNLGLKSWERFENPLAQHARWMGTCPYVEYFLRDDEIRDIKIKNPPIVGIDVRKNFI